MSSNQHHRCACVGMRAHVMERHARSPSPRGYAAYNIPACCVALRSQALGRSGWICCMARCLLPVNAHRQGFVTLNRSATVVHGSAMPLPLQVPEITNSNDSSSANRRSNGCCVSESNFPNDGGHTRCRNRVQANSSGLQPRQARTGSGYPSPEEVLANLWSSLTSVRDTRQHRRRWRTIESCDKFLTWLCNCGVLDHDPSRESNLTLGCTLCLTPLAGMRSIELHFGQHL